MSQQELHEILNAVYAAAAAETSALEQRILDGLSHDGEHSAQRIVIEVEHALTRRQLVDI